MRQIMTDKTDIAALREAALKATAGEWCTDSQHSVIADAGMNANYYVAACSGPDSQINASFIALANPAAIIALLDQLEAEHQRSDKAESYARERDSENESIALTVGRLRLELAALRGAQEPVSFEWKQHYSSIGKSGPWVKLNDQRTYEKLKSKHAGDLDFEFRELFTRQPKPVVVLPNINANKYLNYMFGSQIFDKARFINDCRQALSSAGIVVKDGD
jgi:hypothetical protein